MSKALFRTRVVAAVARGASHREAAARFGVSAASVSPVVGGDRRSGRIEARPG